MEQSTLEFTVGVLISTTDFYQKLSAKHDKNATVPFLLQTSVWEVASGSSALVIDQSEP